MVAVELQECEVGAFAQPGEQVVGDVWRIRFRSAHQRDRYLIPRQPNWSRQFAPIRQHRRNADPPAHPPAWLVDQVLVELAVQFIRFHIRPRAVHLFRPGLRAVGVVRRGEHIVGDVAHPSAVQPDSGIEQHQRRDQIRARGSQIQRHRAAERMSDNHNRAVRVGVEQAGQCADVGVDTPRRRPGRPSVPDQVRCDDREFGQMPRRERLPAPAMPGQAVDGQDLRWTSRSVTMHVQQIGHGLNAASRR